MKDNKQEDKIMVVTAFKAVLNGNEIIIPIKETPVEDFEKMFNNAPDEVFLDLIYQNVSINNLGYSINVGDIIEWKGKKYKCSTFGWKKL